jgi:transcription elongation GreA/GreB family factor
MAGDKPRRHGAAPRVPRRLEEHAMSRAFVREMDDLGPEGPPELPVSRHPNRVTPRGLKLIEKTLADLDRRIAPGPDAGELAWLNRDRRYWAARLASAQVVEPPDDPRAVAFATRVTFRRDGADPETVELVGEDEADPASGRLSWISPLAAVMMGAEPGESVELPGRHPPTELEILAVEPIKPLN